MAIVDTATGKIEGLEHDDHFEFRGVPYSAPPVGPRRLRPPEAVEPWDGTRSATEYGPIAHQMISPIEQFQGLDVSQASEDCLYLNVWTPGLDGNRPVMVWIHGGAFIGGAGSAPWYSGAGFARAGTVFVSLNYRLGALGFLHLDDIGDGYTGAGNLGILDQVAALRWVRDNIAAFGGDPDNVTVFGESAGAMSIGTLLGMPEAKGLFRNAILQSGATAHVHDPDAATLIARETIDALGVDDLTELEGLPAEEFVRAQSQVLAKHWGKGFDLPFQPVADGTTIPQQPLDAIRAGSSDGVRVIAGTTADEMKLFAMIDQTYSTMDHDGLLARATELFGSDELAHEVIGLYTEDATGPGDVWARIQTDRVFRIPAVRLAEARGDDAETYMYRFDFATPIAGGALGSCHALDVPFVFQSLDRPGVSAFVGDVDDGMRALAATMSEAWRRFAAGDSPVVSGMPEWPLYTSEERAVMILGRDVHLEHDPMGEHRAAWDGIR
ncbi:MAG TPA: carboxylesterase/lipase family protein [Actinomycetota bacterium]|nr:carboxylesterase/lipase family protein [Actinomycetota bacterium]